MAARRSSAAGSDRIAVVGGLLAVGVLAVVLAAPLTQQAQASGAWLRLDEPGDCNDDGVIDSDTGHVAAEIFDLDGFAPGDSAGGSHEGCGGCDSNEDGVIDAGDLACEVALIWWGPGGCDPITPTPTPTSTPTFTATATPTPTPTPTPDPGVPEWLSYLNEFRAGAGLELLTEVTSWSDGCWLHSRYMVKEDDPGHDEDPGSPWYTAAGATAAGNGNVAVSSSSTYPDTAFIDLWMTGPFHGVGIIDPKLAETGYGSYRESIGSWRSGATLDVWRGHGSVPPGTDYPIYWPGDGGEQWLQGYWGGEWPDPLSSCPGYSVPSGAPIIVQLGSGGANPNVTATELLDNGSPVDHCWYSESTYTNSDGSAQSLGRSALASRDAVVVIPRSTLTLGHTYTVELTVNGTDYSWSFTVVAPPSRRAPAPKEGEALMLSAP
jgi:hypothetical protein